MMMVAVCGNSIISLDWMSSACSFHWAWLIIVLNAFKTRPRHIIFEWADRQSSVFRRFPFIHFAESGNCRSQRPACYHLHVICFYEAVLWFTGSCRPVTLSLCRSLAVILMGMCKPLLHKSLICWTSVSENVCIRGDVLLCVEALCISMNICLSGLTLRSTHLGRKTLSTT